MHGLVVKVGVAWLVLSSKLDLFHMDRVDLLKTFGRLFCARIDGLAFFRAVGKRSNIRFLLF